MNKKESIKKQLNELLILNDGYAIDSIDFSSYQDEDSVYCDVVLKNGKKLYTTTSFDKDGNITNQEINYKDDKNASFLLYKRKGDTLEYCVFDMIFDKTWDVIIPKGVRKVSPNCFFGSSVHNVEFQNDVEMIGRSAFSNSKLEKIGKRVSPDRKLEPLNLKSVGDYAFAACRNLQSIDNLKSTQYDFLGYGAFKGVKKVEKQFDKTAMEKVVRLTQQNLKEANNWIFKLSEKYKNFTGEINLEIDKEIIKDNDASSLCENTILRLGEKIKNKNPQLNVNVIISDVEHIKDVNEKVSYMYSQKEIGNLEKLNNAVRKANLCEQILFQEDVRYIDHNESWDFDKIKEANRFIDQFINDMRSKENFPKPLTSMEKLLYVYSFVSNVVVTESGAMKDGINFDNANRKRSVLSAFDTRGMCCAGYSALFKAIIDKLNDKNIQCKLNSVNIQGMGHANNIVTITDPQTNKKYDYVIDTTMAAPDRNGFSFLETFDFDLFSKAMVNPISFMNVRLEFFLFPVDDLKNMNMKQSGKNQTEIATVQMRKIENVEESKFRASPAIPVKYYIDNLYNLLTKISKGDSDWTVQMTVGSALINAGYSLLQYCKTYNVVENINGLNNTFQNTMKLFASSYHLKDNKIDIPRGKIAKDNSTKHLIEMIRSIFSFVITYIETGEYNVNDEIIKLAKEESFEVLLTQLIKENEFIQEQSQKEGKFQPNVDDCMSIINAYLYEDQNEAE